MGNVPTGFWDSGNMKAVGGSSIKIKYTITIEEPCQLIIHNKDRYLDIKSTLIQNKVKFNEYNNEN